MAAYWFRHLRDLAHRERQRQRGIVREVDEDLPDIRRGVAKIDRDLLRAERDLHGFAATSAQRKDVLRIGVRSDLQAVEVRRLRRKARIVHDHVVVAIARKRNFDTRVEARPAERLRCAPAPCRWNPALDHRIDRRAAAPSLHFNHALLAGLGVDAVDVALRPRELAIDGERPGRQRLRTFDRVVAIGKGPRRATLPR